MVTFAAHLQLNTTLRQFITIGGQSWWSVCAIYLTLREQKSSFRQIGAKVSQAIEILSHQDGPYPLPDVLKTDELEEWRKKWVYESKLY